MASTLLQTRKLFSAPPSRLVISDLGPDAHLSSPQTLNMCSMSQNCLEQTERALPRFLDIKLEADNLGTQSMEWRYHGTHLFDFLWTSFPPYRRLPGSASAAYTWQLCFYGVLLGVVGVEEWAHLELIESSQESIASKECKFCQL